MSNPPHELKADNIDGVIRSLDQILTWAEENNRRCGYFAALYRKVTVRVKHGIENDEFENGARLEKLDVIFANRYLDAFERYHQNKPVTQSWQVAFHASEQRQPIVLQHLLLGMNAHIGLDLGMAAAETVAPHQLADLKNDFEKINAILSSLVNHVQDELAQIWPTLKLLDRFAGTVDERLADAFMQLARNSAWHVAKTLSQTPPDSHETVIQQIDDKVSKQVNLILFKGFWITLIVWLIRISESRSVSRNIQILR